MLDRAEFDALFSAFTESAFRLETCESYNQPEEAEAVRRFTAGEEPDDGWLADFAHLLRRIRTGSRVLQRVRVLDHPPTDYQRFVMDLARRCNVPAGEDLRTLDRDVAEQLGVTRGTDFWIFDDKIVARMFFADGRFTGAELITDAAHLRGFRDLRRRTWEAAEVFPAGAMR